MKPAPEHPVSKGYIRGEQIPEYVYSPDRIKYPMRWVNNTWERVSWDEALDYAASELTKIKEKYGPKTLAIFCAQWALKILRSGFSQRFKSANGTPNLL
ncbi:MAG: putative dimethyl sulfoxide reductase chain YnfE precursor [Pelotomaculum sp. PtaB.Bin104]|nr:MAG: putative dimethyl sulfoxide reductase chain YnfE precursor [Pelotomaculum sp. PtaB.Bin104]